MSINYKKLSNKIENIVVKSRRLKSVFFFKSDLHEVLDKRKELFSELYIAFENFENTKFSQQELEILEFIDDENFLTKKGILILNRKLKFINNIKKIEYVDDEKNQNPYKLIQSDSSKILLLKREDLENRFTFYPKKEYSKFNKFIDGRFDEGFSWRDGLTLKLNYEGHAKTVSSFSNVLSKWDKILKSFSRLSEGNDSEFGINNIREGSILLTICASAYVIVQLSKGLNQVLDVIKKSYEIKKLSIELKKLKVESQKELDKIEEEATINSDRAAEEIANDIIEPYGKDDKNEVKNALKISIVYLFKFFDEGGDAKLLLSPVTIKEVPESQKMKENVETKIDEIDKTRETIKKMLGNTDIKLIE